MTEWLMHNQTASRIPYVDEQIIAPLTQAWKKKLSDTILTQQVSNKDQLFSCCIDGLYCHRSSNGDFLWKLEPITVEGQHNLLKSTPAIHNDDIYLTDTMGNLYCIDAMDGHVNWINHDYGTRNDSICIVNDQIFSRCALTKEGKKHHGFISTGFDGKMNWSYLISSPIRTRSCSVFNNQLFFGDSNGIFHSVDVSNGNPLWSSDIKPIAKRIEIPQKFQKKEISFVGMPMAAGETVVVSCDDRRNIFGFNILTGDITWHHLVDDDFDFVSSAFQISDDGDKFYYIIKNFLRSIDHETGQIRNTFQLGADMGKSRSIESLIVGDHLIAGFHSKQQIIGFNKISGSSDWILTSENGFATGCIWSSGKLFAGDEKGVIYCFQQGN